MRNINKVILIGNVARAPETRTTAGGQKMTTFVLATNRTWYNPNGGKQSQAEFHNMLAWGKIAEICEKFLQKSTLVYLEGYLKTRSWENEQGQRFYRTEVVVQDILVLDRGIRHTEGAATPVETPAATEEVSDFDFSSDNDSIFGDEKPASEIEKSFQEKLSEGNTNVADTNLSSENSAVQEDVSLDTPLFEEESR